MTATNDNWGDNLSDVESHTSSAGDSDLECEPVPISMRLVTLKPKCEVLIQREHNALFNALEWHEYRKYNDDELYRLYHQYHKSEDVQSLMDWSCVDFDGVKVETINYFSECDTSAVYFNPKP